LIVTGVRFLSDQVEIRSFFVSNEVKYSRGVISVKYLNSLVMCAWSKNPMLGDYCKLLFDIALVAEGGKIDNPAEFSKAIADLMTKAI